MKAAVHRFAQGIGALSAFARAPDLELARRHLSICEYNAFRHMARSEQLHSLNVLQKALSIFPQAPQALITAALLHDVGKSRCHLSLWQKTLAVIIEEAAPRTARRLSDDDAISIWRAPFIVRRHHAKWGGEILSDCGSDVDAIWLVERHQDFAEKYRDNWRYVMLATLQRADGEC